MTVTPQQFPRASRTTPWRRYCRRLHPRRLDQPHRHVAIAPQRGYRQRGVNSNDFSDLHTIVADPTSLEIPGYVQVLAGDIVDGNPANAHYQGQTLGNLAVGRCGQQMTELLDKWFLGTDHPAAENYTYHATAGTLFGSSGPHYTDANQGVLGDCYFISAIGTIAKADAAAIQSMFINNGDNTYTVRFYLKAWPIT